MPSQFPELREQTARLAAARRWQHPNADDLQRELEVERLAVIIERANRAVTFEVDDVVRLVDTLCGRPSGHGET